MPLSNIINLPLLTRIVSSNFKIAKVVPTYKNGKRNHPYNYRPLSILPSITKILEKLFANRSFAFLKK